MIIFLSFMPSLSEKDFDAEMALYILHLYNYEVSEYTSLANTMRSTFYILLISYDSKSPNFHADSIFPIL